MLLLPAPKPVLLLPAPDPNYTISLTSPYGNTSSGELYHTFIKGMMKMIAEATGV